MKTELTITHYNITALIGWAGILLGLVGAAIQYFVPSAPGIYYLVIGLIGGGITLTFAEPWRTITKRQVELRECERTPKHR